MLEAIFGIQNQTLKKPNPISQIKHFKNILQNCNNLETLLSF
jgi:hypothetical protein